MNAKYLRILPIVLLVALVAGQAVFSYRALMGAVYASRGGNALDNRGLDAAARAYSRALDYAPYRGDWQYAHAGAARDVAGHEAALPFYAKALDRAPYSEATMVAAAESFLLAGRVAEATALIDRAQALTPNDWRVHHLKGLVASMEQRNADAVTELQAAAELATQIDPRIQNQLANALYATGAYLEAERAASRAIDVEPLAPEHYLIRGKARLALGNAADARKDFGWSAMVYRKRLDQGMKVTGLVADSEERLAFAMLAEQSFDDVRNPLDRLYADGLAYATPVALRLDMWLRRSGSSTPVSVWVWTLDVLVESGEFERADELLARARVTFPGSDGAALIPSSARLMLADGRTADALAMLGDAPEDIKSTLDFRLAYAQALAASGRVASARLEYLALADAPGASLKERRMAEAGLAALSTQ